MSVTREDGGFGDILTSIGSELKKKKIGEKIEKRGIIAKMRG